MNFLGLTINGYCFLEVVGSGSFGTVYKVQKDDNIFAAKVFAESFVLSEYKNDRNRITNEIDALKIVDSENLVKYYDTHSAKCCVRETEAAVRSECAVPAETES